MNDCIVIIPTYNEIENIESIIRSVLSQHKPFHILIVDDNSPDRTADKVVLLQKEFDGRLFLENRKKKSGLGTAYVHGFRWALERKYNFIFEMDADFSHNPNDLEKLYNACHFGNADLAIGSRYVTGVNVVNWPLNRVLMSYFASVYVRIITGMKIHDATAGFVCCKKFSIVEVPIIFTDRTKGESKMSNSIIVEAVFGVISLRLKKLVNSL